MVKSIVIVAGLLAGFAAIPAQPVLADAATHQTFTSSPSGDNLLTCPNFLIDNSWALTVKTTVWSDADGNFIRGSSELHLDAVLTKMSLDGSTVLGTYLENGNTHGTFDASGAETFSGLGLQIVGPDGMIAHDVGRVSYDANGNLIFQSGQHDPLVFQVCFALA
jgi:hypothetical protein